MPLSLEIVTPDGVAWKNDDVQSVTLPTTSGEIEVLAGHIPLITILSEGAVGVVVNGHENDIAIDRGYARVIGDVVSVLTEAAVNVENIDMRDIEEAKTNAQKAIEEARKNRISDEEMERLEAVFRFSVAQLLAKGKKK